MLCCSLWPGYEGDGAEDWGALGPYWAPVAVYCPPWRYCCAGYPCGARESAPVGKGVTTCHSLHQCSTHLIGVCPLKALAGQLLALGRARIGVLRHSLPTIEGTSPGHPHWAHAHRGDTRGGHNTCHASRAHAVGATGPGMGQELAAERLPCAHLQQRRERGHGRAGGAVSAPALPQPGSYRTILAQLLALFLLQCCHRCCGCGCGCGSSGSHSSSSCCLGEISSGSAGMRGEPHPSGATWATIVAGE